MVHLEKNKTNWMNTFVDLPGFVDNFINEAVEYWDDDKEDYFSSDYIADSICERARIDFYRKWKK